MFRILIAFTVHAAYAAPGNSFGVWDGKAIALVDTKFDLARSMALSIEEERDELSDDDNAYVCIEAPNDARRGQGREQFSPLRPPRKQTIDCAIAPVPFDGYQRLMPRTCEHRKRKGGIEVRTSLRRQYIDTAVPLMAGIHLSRLRITRAGYTSTCDAPERHRAYRLEEVVGPDSQFQ
ncbi:hypothetical protein EV714DRAFT_278289 [Schizophyllum commune]